jgi:uncharacterized HAD superfamily protein
MSLINKIVLFDLDGTLCVEECWTAEECKNATLREDIAEKLNELYQKNFIVIYTARRDENIPATLEWLRRNNIRFHAITNLKSAADVYIDDKALRPEEI